MKRYRLLINVATEIARQKYQKRYPNFVSNVFISIDVFSFRPVKLSKRIGGTIQIFIGGTKMNAIGNNFLVDGK